MALRSKTSTISFALLWAACLIGLWLLAFASRAWDAWAVALLSLGVAGLLLERVWFANVLPLLPSAKPQVSGFGGLQNDSQLISKTKAEPTNTSKLSYSALAQACHDLRQPTMASSLSISAARALTQEPQTAQHLDAALKASDELNRMIQSMLDLTELSEQAAPPEMKALPLRPLLQAVREQFTLPADSNSDQAIVSIRIRCRDDQVIGHAPWITRVLLNLVGNSLQHAKAQRILITARQIHGRVHLSVWDDGVGMTAQQIAQLSQDVKRKGAAPSSQTNKNFGLGSAIAQRYARAMGSELRVWSAPGRGSRFDLALPAASSPDAPAVGSMIEPMIETLAQKLNSHVLVLSQDAQFNRQLLPSLQAACACVSVRSVQEFLQHGLGLSLDELAVSIMILDEQSMRASHGLESMTYLVRQELGSVIQGIWIMSEPDSSSDAGLPPDVIRLERPLVLAHLLQAIADHSST